MKDFSALAPLSRYLLQQALLHMVNICSNPTLDVNESKDETAALKSWSGQLVIWIFDALIDCVKGEAPTADVADSVYAQRVLCSQVVNLVFKGIAMLTGTNRLCFVRLLSALIKMNVTFDSDAAHALKVTGVTGVT